MMFQISKNHKIMTIRTTLIAALVSVCCSTFAQNANPMQLRNQFQREIQSPDATWMSYYNLAYADLMMILGGAPENTVQPLLDEAEKMISKLGNDKTADASEVAALKALRYLAMMSVNPQVYGPKHSGDLGNACATALALNPDNPRAIIIQAMFQANMASFMNTQYDPSKDFARAAELLGRQDKDAPGPKWGMEFIQAVSNR